MNTSIYEYNSYKNYLKKLLSPTGEGRGQRSKLAKFLGCQTGFISQVLKGTAHFSFEHGIKINNFLEHNHDTAHFFMLLMHRDKAGSIDLLNYYQNQIEEIKRKRNLIKSRIVTSKKLNRSDQLTYYSNWYYAAIHILISINQFQTIKSITKKLQLTSDIVLECLEFLVNKGLAIEIDGKFQIGKTRIHLSHNSSIIFKHHINWRIEAIKSLELRNENNLHYSGVFSLSKQDVNKIKKILLKSIESMEPIISDSAEEELIAISMDLHSY